MTKRKHKIIESNNHVNLVNIRDFLPIGSIVRLTSTDKQKFMIFGISKDDPTCKYRSFDYVAVEYPEGSLVDEQTVFFNHNDIAEVLHKGYMDEDYQDYIDMIASCQNL